MDFSVERGSSLGRSLKFNVLRAFIIAIPALYFVYILSQYYFWTSEAAAVNDRISEMQRNTSRLEKEMKNSVITIAGCDTVETIVKKGFFYDIKAFSDIVEIIVSESSGEKMAKLQSALSAKMRKNKISERELVESFFTASEAPGQLCKISGLQISFSEKRTKFSIVCDSKETLASFLEKMRAQKWAGRVIADSVKFQGKEVLAYITIMLKEAEIFE